MTTLHHTDHAFGAPLTSVEVNRPLGELDAALDLAMTSGSGWSTTLSGTAASGQKVVPVVSTVGALVGMAVYIGTPGGTTETRTIQSIAAGVSVTVSVNLTNSYAAGALISASPAEVVDARNGSTSLNAYLASRIGSLSDRGTGMLALGTGITPALPRPVQVEVPMVGPGIVAAPVTDNVIGITTHPKFTGNFTGMGGADPGFAWGSWEWVTIGAAANDGLGITTLYGKEVEMGFLGGTGFNATGAVHALVADTQFWAGSSGHIGVLDGLFLPPPNMRPGVGVWTIDNNYLLHIGAPGSVGTFNFALLTDGGPSRFNGRLDIIGALVQTDQMTLGGAAFPGGAQANDVFYRTDRKSWFYFNGTTWLPLGAVVGLARRITAIAVANTFTSVISAPIPIGMLVAGTVLKVTAYGRLTSGATGGSSTFDLFSPGGSVYASITILNANSKTNAPFKIEAMVTVRTVGAGGTAIGAMEVKGGIGNPPFTTAGEISAISAAVAVNTTIAQALDMAYTSGNAGTTATFEGIEIQIINP